MGAGVEDTMTSITVGETIPSIVPTWATTFRGSIHEWWWVISPDCAGKNTFVVFIFVEDPLLIFVWILDEFVAPPLSVSVVAVLSS